MQLHLITDEGFLCRVLLSLAIIVGVPALCWQVPVLQDATLDLFEWCRLQMLQTAHRMAWWSALGLLSSSCCIIQVILSFMQVGCAGFNTVLGPVRPALIAFTIAAQCSSWYIALSRPWLWMPTAAASVLAVSLTMSPEALALYSWFRRERQNGLKKASSVAMTRSVGVIQFEKIGCMSCVHSIRAVLGTCNAVLWDDVSAVTGRATIRLGCPPGPSADEALREVVDKTAEAGFQGRVLSVTSAAGLNASEALASDADDGQRKEQEPSMGWARELAQSLVAGLLGSSCCALQLGMNSLATLGVLNHVGCAGFNKVLGPLRTPLRIATAVWGARLWYVYLSHSGPPQAVRTETGHGKSSRQRLGRLLVSSAFCAVLTFLPEILLQSGGPALAPPSVGAERVALQIDGMGCEACQAHVQALLESSSGIVSSSVDFKTGHAELFVAPNWSFDADAIAAQLEWDGYELRSVEKGDIMLQSQAMEPGGSHGGL